MTRSLLRSADGSGPSSRKAVAALWDAGLFAEGERIWGGFSKGTGTDQSTSPAPAWLLKNPPLLRFEKVFIVICWFCLGPVLRSVAGPERSGKTC